MLARCPCGCQFTHASTLSRAVCPSCGRELTAGGEASPPLSNRQLTILIGGAAGVLVLLLGVLLIARRSNDPLRELPMAEAPSLPPPPPAPVRPQPPPAPEPAAPPQETLVYAPAPPPRPDGPVVEPRADLGPVMARVNRLVEHANLAGLLAAVMRIRGAIEAAEDFERRLKAADDEIRALTQPHAKRTEVASLAPRVIPGDVVDAFGTTAREPRPGMLADAILDWFRIFQPGAYVLATVRRDDETFTVAMFFTTRDAELAEALSLAGVIPGAGGVDEDAVARALPTDLTEDARGRLARLHPGLRVRIPPDEAARAEALLAARRGTPADERFLRVRFLQEIVAPLEEEIAVHARRAEELEKLGIDSLYPDALVFKDGRRLACRILEEDAAGVDIRIPVGKGRVAKDGLRAVERGDAPLEEFQSRYAQARTDPQALVRLLDWCATKTLPLQRELAASRLLVLDPGHARGRSELGLPALAEAGALPAPDHAADIVRLRDGASRAGLIVAETETSLTLEIPARGPRGEVVGALRETIAKSRIVSIDRLPEEARRRALAERATRAEHERRAEEAVERSSAEPASFAGVNGLRVQSARFEMFSTCPDRESRETARALESLFEAFEAAFPVRRNANRRLQVYYFADRRMYEAFQRGTRGAVTSETAYYSARENHLAAFTDMGAEEAADLRRRIEVSTREIARLKKAVPAEERRVAEQIRRLHADFAEQIERANEAAKTLPGGFRAARARTLQQWRATRQAEIAEEERALRARAADFRREVQAAIQHHQSQIRSQAALLRSPSREKDAHLFHQAFHAFVANFLWEPSPGLRWLEEGMALHFEAAVVEPGGVRPGPPPWTLLMALREHRRGGRALPIEAVVRGAAEAVRLDDAGHARKPGAEAAHAWALAQFLRSRASDRARLDACLSEMAGGVDPIEALERMLGRPRARVQADFEAYVEGLAGLRR